MYQYQKGLFIFYRDFRYEDNIALLKCIQECNEIILIFIFTPQQITSKNKFLSYNSLQFLLDSLDSLNKSISNKINILYGDNYKIINYIINKYNIESIYFNKDITPYANKRDNKIIKLCNSKNIICNYYNDYYLFETNEILTNSNTHYKKFTPYYNKAINHLETKIIKVITNIKLNLSQFIKIRTEYNLSIKQIRRKYLTIINNNIAFIGSRKEGLNKLQNINSNYETNRNLLICNTTELSPYIKYGLISVREVYKEMIKNKSKDELVRQLIWRDFYAQLLLNQPELLIIKYNIKWNKNNYLFQRWKNGKTGFPIVDACMRQLNETGYIQNRARLIVSSFLVKVLLIDWKKGEKYFAQKLIDYDPASNNGNWQWVAGVGVDSQPYFRLFNPWIQSKKFDKDALYIKKWLPEFKNIEPNIIHKWNEYYLNNNYKSIYIKPIVNYINQSKKIKQIYKNK